MGKTRAARGSISTKMTDYLGELGRSYGISGWGGADVYLRDRYLDKLILKIAAKHAQKSGRRIASWDDMQAAMLEVGHMKGIGSKGKGKTGHSKYKNLVNVMTKDLKRKPRKLLKSIPRDQRYITNIKRRSARRSSSPVY